MLRCWSNHWSRDPAVSAPPNRFDSECCTRSALCTLKGTLRGTLKGRPRGASKASLGPAGDRMGRPDYVLRSEERRVGQEYRSPRAACAVEIKWAQSGVGYTG